VVPTVVHTISEVNSYRNENEEVEEKHTHHTVRDDKPRSDLETRMIAAIAKDKLD
jgi:hypothetical protein